MLRKLSRIKKKAIRRTMTKILRAGKILREGMMLRMAMMLRISMMSMVGKSMVRMSMVRMSMSMLRRILKITLNRRDLSFYRTNHQ